MRAPSGSLLVSSDVCKTRCIISLSFPFSRTWSQGSQDRVHCYLSQHSFKCRFSFTEDTIEHTLNVHSDRAARVRALTVERQEMPFFYGPVNFQQRNLISRARKA